MQQAEMDSIAAQLADNRTHSRLTDVPLDRIRWLEEAQAIQAAALDAYDRDFNGYTLVGTNETSRRSLGLVDPILSEIPIRDCVGNENRFRLPQGIIGVQCEIALMIGPLDFEKDVPITPQTFDKALLACMPAIGVVGRRAHIGADPHLSAVADFGLHVATLTGPAFSQFDMRMLDKVKVVARIDGKPMISFTGTSSGPLDAALWLHHALQRRGLQINATDVITTGSLGPILQVLPGQHLSVEWGDIGSASCWFE